MAAVTGDMALRTKCLECENYTERKEEYQDMSVAVKKDQIDNLSDDEDDGEAAGMPSSVFVCH